MKYILLFLLIVITLYRCFWNLNQSPIERWDESTNLSVITETRLLGSFPVLYLSGKPFFEKPPLWYWLQVVSPYTPRVISAVFGFLAVLLTALLAWKWWGGLASFTAWTVLLTTNQLFVTNPEGIFSTHTFRSGDVDSLFILLMVASIATTRWKLQGFLAGLALLTKGPLGILPLLLFSKAWLIALAVAVPWYAYMTIRFGQTFVSEHIGYHMASRALSPIEGHTYPLWYFGSIITNRSFFLSWEILAAALMWIMVRQKDTKAVRIAVLTILFFLIPTLIQTKLAWYVLPMYPFAALSIGYAVSEAISHYRKRY